MPSDSLPLTAAPFDGARPEIAHGPASAPPTCTLKALKPGSEPYDFKCDSPGLYLRVWPTGVKTFRLLQKRYDAAKARRATAVTTLGEWPGFPLAEARKQAWDRAGRVVGSTERLTVAERRPKFLDAHESGAHAWRYNTTKNYSTYRAALVGALGSRPLADVKRVELSDILRRYAARGPVAGNRLASFATGFWRWALGEGLTESDLTATLGAKQRLPGGRRAEPRPSATDAEIRDLWRVDAPHANLLRALILTGCRISELQRATTVHLDGDWLTIPKEHAKNKKEHRVYITPEMRAQFDGSAPLLFRAISQSAVQGWLRRRALGWMPHDLRRTFATLCARASVQPHIIVGLLNQTGTDSRLSATLGVYQRFDYADERRAATLCRTRPWCCGSCGCGVKRGGCGPQVTAAPSPTERKPGSLARPARLLSRGA